MYEVCLSGDIGSRCQVGFKITGLPQWLNYRKAGRGKCMKCVCRETSGRDDRLDLRLQVSLDSRTTRK